MHVYLCLYIKEHIDIDIKNNNTYYIINLLHDAFRTLLLGIGWCGDCELQTQYFLLIFLFPPYVRLCNHTYISILLSLYCHPFHCS